MHLSPLFATLAGISAASAAVDLGYWDVNLTSVRSAQGAEAMYTTAIHSSNPSHTIIDQYQYFGNTTTLRNTHSFSIDIRSICGLGPSSKTSAFPNAGTRICG